jgi:hypothetical protein
MALSNLNSWIVFQLVIDFVLVVMILFFIRRMKSRLRQEAARETSLQLVEMIEPLIKETEAVANSFEAQLKEKKHLINRLNEDLDSRIISLNLLLNRAKAYMDDESGKPAATGQVYRQQEAILELYAQNYDTEAIAKKLSMPKGEVELVIDLKTKFLSYK